MFFEFLFPRRCVFCHRVLVSGERDLCVRCVHETALGKAHLLALKDRAEALRVENIDALFDFARCRRALEDFKYGRQLYKGRILGKMWANHLREFEWAREADLILPMPMNRWKMLQRGYNQSEFLAGILSKQLGVPLCRNAVERKWQRTSQVKSKNRWSNIKGVFCLNDKVGRLLSGKSVLIVDDVITSSATVSELLRVLRAVDGLRVSLAFLSAEAKS